MSDDRSAIELWYEWFDKHDRTWLPLGDSDSAWVRQMECTAAIDCDDSTGERMAFLFRTFDPDGWFMVLDRNPMDDPDARPSVEWIQDAHGRMHALTRLADFVATLVPSLADAGCPGLNPSDEIIGQMQEMERRQEAVRNTLSPTEEQSNG